MVIMGTFPGLKYLEVVNLTNYDHLILRFGICGVLPPHHLLSLYVSMM
jgi:hypothetical protein